jgi:hypothetical protein
MISAKSNFALMLVAVGVASSGCRLATAPRDHGVAATLPVSTLDAGSWAVAPMQLRCPPATGKVLVDLRADGTFATASGTTGRIQGACIAATATRGAKRQPTVCVSTDGSVQWDGSATPPPWGFASHLGSDGTVHADLGSYSLAVADDGTIVSDPKPNTPCRWEGYQPAFRRSATFLAAEIANIPPELTMPHPEPVPTPP